VPYARPALEELINSHIRALGARHDEHDAAADRAAGRATDQREGDRADADRRSAVILCSPQIRGAVRRMIESSLPQVAVLAYNEIVPEVAVEAVGLVGMNG
jgi:flagellar biosynthesis protein FlhA